eukprot:RCo022545
MSALVASALPDPFPRPSFPSYGSSPPPAFPTTSLSPFSGTTTPFPLPLANPGFSYPRPSTGLSYHTPPPSKPILPHGDLPHSFGSLPPSLPLSGFPMPTIPSPTITLSRTTSPQPSETVSYSYPVMAPFSSPPLSPAFVQYSSTALPGPASVTPSETRYAYTFSPATSTSSYSLQPSMEWVLSSTSPVPPSRSFPRPQLSPQGTSSPAAAASSSSTPSPSTAVRPPALRTPSPSPKRTAGTDGAPSHEETTSSSSVGLQGGAEHAAAPFTPSGGTPLSPETVSSASPTLSLSSPRLATPEGSRRGLSVLRSSLRFLKLGVSSLLAAVRGPLSKSRWRGSLD